MEREHASQLVDLVDESGVVVGNKPRKAINKQVDLYHSVFVLLVTPDKKLVLSQIPRRDDLPNLYAGKLGSTIATIRRQGETAVTAAHRAAAAELFCHHPQLHHLGDQYQAFADGHRTYTSVYYYMGDPAPSFSATDIRSLVAMTADELEAQIRHDAGQFAPTFAAIWSRHRRQLPI